MTIREMARVTKLNGTLYSNAPSRGKYHAYPGDNFRFYRDAAAALAFWCGKTNEGRRYPIAVVQQKFMDDAAWNYNVMVWRRTDTPAVSFTLDGASVSSVPGGTKARKGKQQARRGSRLLAPR